MTEDCGGHGHEKKKGLYRYLAIGAIITVVSIGLTVLIVWLDLKPSKPQFHLQDYTLYSLNFSQPSFLTSTIQVTIATRNPNQKMGINYQKLDVYTTYRDQPVTLPTQLPVGYLGHKETAVWSPYMIGNFVPVSPLMANQLTQDLNAGRLLLYVRVNARLKWKVGTWMSRHYGVKANCPAYLINFGDHQVANGNDNGNVNGGFTGGFGVKYPFVQDCIVELY